MSKEVNVLEVSVPLKMFGEAIEAVAGLPGSPHGPTVLTRWALRGISTFIRDRNGHYNCADCGERSHDAYMVNKDVWHDVLHESEIGKQGMFLHLKCLDTRVLRAYGRRLRIGDFQDLPINEGIRAGYTMGRRERTRSTMCPDCGGNALGSPPCGSCFGTGMIEEPYYDEE